MAPSAIAVDVTAHALMYAAVLTIAAKEQYAALRDVVATFASVRTCPTWWGMRSDRGWTKLRSGYSSDTS
jgi:hypothetical protein